MTIDEQIMDHLLHIRRALELVHSDAGDILRPVNPQSWYEGLSRRLDCMDARLARIEQHLDRELPF
jgi:hypothetical protein